MLGRASIGKAAITLTDSSEAVVKGAKIVVSGADTGAVVRTIAGNDSGIADVPLVQPGRCNVPISTAGFRDIDRNGVIVSVDCVISLNITLTVGESAETVTVTGDATEYAVDSNPGLSHPSLCDSS